LELFERRSREAKQGDIAVVEVDEAAVEVIREVRAPWARPRVIRAKHDVVGEQLWAPVEELHQRLRPLVGREAVFLLGPHPRQLLALAR
jgi:hypothetical protein